MAGLPVNQEETIITVKTKHGISHWRIRLEKPKGDDDYGTGIYLHATPVNNNGADVYRDFRYAKTEDIQKLTDIWVKEYFVSNDHQKIKKTIKYYV